MTVAAPSPSGAGEAKRADTLSHAPTQPPAGRAQPPASESETLSPQEKPAAVADVPQVAGYAIGAEVGRGGMGVVYEARQVALKRRVALKMILAGPHAGPGEVARFRTEAEAIARLQHPNIVQIHDIGEYQGLPYFALEFVDGGSLADVLAASRPTFRQSARVVATLARAMHAAHQAGIIHRDLKPANVLLTADGQPKIADFGLAKVLDDPTGRTASGAVMGTPSYMAPEQAGGKSKDIGPATDIYALGAILYELLTGRPPFRGPAQMDTLMQVIADDPVPPRQLNPKVSRDLETICLMCLRKDPQKRYASAEHLADDLDRVRAGTPIQGRRAGAGEVALRWMKDQPAAALGLGSGLLLLLGMSWMLNGGWTWLAVATTAAALFLVARMRVFLIASGAATAALALALAGLLLWQPEADQQLFKVRLQVTPPPPNRPQAGAANNQAARPAEGPGQFELFLLSVAPLPEMIGNALWRASRYVYLTLLVLCGGIFLGGVIGFAAGQETQAMIWYVPALAVAVVAGAVAACWIPLSQFNPFVTIPVASRACSAVIGGVAIGLLVGTVSRGIACWLARDLVATVQGAVYGCLLGMFGELALLIWGFRLNLDVWSRFVLHPIQTGSLAVALFLLCTVLGAIHGAFTGKRQKEKPGRQPSAKGSGRRRRLGTVAEA